MASDFVHLRADGIGVLLEIAPHGLPGVVHWGADLGELSDAEAVALSLANQLPRANNEPDEPVRLSVLPEHSAGWLGRPGVSGSRGGVGWSPRWRVDSVTVSTDSGPRAAGAGLVEARAAVVEASDSAAGLGVVLWFELLAGGVLRARAELTNTGSDAYQLDDLSLALPVPERASELLDFAGRWTRERSPQRHDFGVGSWTREGRHGRTGADAATLLHAGTPGFGFDNGEVWAVHLGWSGNHRHLAERLWTGAKVLGGGELLWPGEVVLAPQQSYASPWLYAAHGVGLDAVARRFHAYLRSRPDHVDAERPVTLNVWEAVYFDHDLDRLCALAEQAAALGVERFVLDDGWFGSRRDDRSGLGDWQVSAEAWPHGLTPLIDRVAALGMQFGLWVEPEMINEDSDIARAHPEWIMRLDAAGTPMASRHQQVINLGDPDCYAYVHGSLQALLDEYRIGYLKWDHNRDLIDAGGRGGRPGTREQTLATYRLMAQLKADNPGLEIESCSSGGARVDLGVLQYTDRVWTSDCIDTHERQLMNRWTAQLLPPELMGSHIGSGRAHTTSRIHDLDYRAATAIFGHLGIEWDLGEATPEELTALGQWIALYRAQRPLLLGGELFRLDTGDDSLHVHGVLAPDRRRALVSWSAIDRSPVVYPGRLRIPGLDADVRYRLRPLLVGAGPRGLRLPPWCGDAAQEHPGIELSGAALAGPGLAAPLLDPDQTVLFTVEAVSG